MQLTSGVKCRMSSESSSPQIEPSEPGKPNPSALYLSALGHLLYLHMDFLNHRINHFNLHFCPFCNSFFTGNTIDLLSPQDDREDARHRRHQNLAPRRSLKGDICEVEIRSSEEAHPSQPGRGSCSRRAGTRSVHIESDQAVGSVTL